MRILLTGATGFLGSHLAKALVDQGHDIFAVRRRNSDGWRLGEYEQRIRWFELEAAPLDDVFRLAQPVDFVIHTAACYGRNMSPSHLIRDNVLFSAELFEAATASGVRTFFNADSALDPGVSLYGLSKSQGAEWLRRLAGAIRVVNIRLQLMYGFDDDWTKFPASMIRNCLQNQPVVALTDGLQKRDFIHVDDVVSAYLHLVERCDSLPFPVCQLSLGSGRAVSIRDFCLLVQRLSASASALDFGALPRRENEPEICVADLQPLSALGWKPAIDLETGLKMAIAEIRKRL